MCRSSVIIIGNDDSTLNEVLESGYCSSGLGQIKQLMADDNKFREKIESKQFLIGRFETSLNEKLKRKAKRPKKIESKEFGYAESRFRAMLEKQVKPHL